MNIKEKILLSQNIFNMCKLVGTSTVSITGDLGEFMVADKLGTELADFNQKGYDMICPKGLKHQVKTKRLRENGNPRTIVHKVDPYGDYDVIHLLVIDNDGNEILHEEFLKSSVKTAFEVRENRNSKNWLTTPNVLSKFI